MSYDLRIYTIEKQDFSILKSKFNINITKDGFIYPLSNHQIVVTNENPIEDEDIPQQVGKELPGLKYLIECNLEPITDKEKHIKELLKIGKIIAKNGIGVIENPQTDEIILPSGIKRVFTTEKTERFSVLELSWWFNDNSILQNDNLRQLLNIIEKHMPEALPRRYGEYEPPKEKFIDINTFNDYLLKNVRNSIVWYPNKPVDYVHFGIPEYIGPMRIGYRFGIFSISMDSIVLSMPGWKTSITRLFKNISSILNPFYGDIYILKNHVRSRTVSLSDRSTEHHPIVSWWWNGIPKNLGIGMVIGNQLHEFVKIKKPTFELDNNCKIIISDDFKELSLNDLEINKNIYQVKDNSDNIFGGAKKLYPKIWPFDGPFKD